jgi:Zn-finger nucleic acid-binding protein
MAYLNCPSCRLTVYSPARSSSIEECPRCRAKLGKVSSLFRSALPPRLMDKEAGGGPRPRVEQ